MRQTDALRMPPADRKSGFGVSSRAESRRSRGDSPVKKLLLLVLVVVGAWFAWDRFKPPALQGRILSEDERVTFTSAEGRVSIADYLQKDTWTLMLFTERGSSEGKSLEARLERIVRQRVKTVRLVVIDVGGLQTSAAEGLGLKRLPAARLFDAYRQKSDDIEEILEILGA